MGKKDIITKDYMNDEEVFADAFNFLIYGGKRVIEPERLRSMDTAQMAVPYGAEGAVAPEQRYRDGLKCLAAMRDEETAYLILGNENQSEVHYAMPVRNMLYDALQYAAQVKEAAGSHHRAKDAKGQSAGEYLGGFYKNDKLIPIVTLVILFHGDKWDGPLSIHDMLDFRDEEILPFVENYRIHLIEPYSMEPEQLGQFHSSLREVVTFLKYSKDGEMLEKMLLEDDGFRHLDLRAARVLAECGNIELEIGEEDQVDMCKAISDIKRKGYEEGRRVGEERGIEQGIFMTLCSLVRDGILKPEDAAKQGNVSIGEFLGKMQIYGVQCRLNER